MLDARRAEQKGYITLKQAAEISNYSPDYVGQLIRSGKIRGEQVYHNVAWVTTETEIKEYLTRSKARAPQAAEVLQEAVVARYTNPVIYTGIFLVSLVLLFVLYVLFASIDDAIDRAYTAELFEEPHAYSES